MTEFRAVAGQSPQDVCINTYGKMDNFVKLLLDSGVSSMDAEIYSNQPFVWDENLVSNQATSIAIAAAKIRYATDISALGNLFYIVPSGGPILGPPPTGVPTTNKIDMVFFTTYDCNADGTTAVVVNDTNGNPITGFDVFAVELETKPMKSDGSEWSWNKTTATLTLLGGLTIDRNMRLSVWYKKTTG